MVGHQLQYPGICLHTSKAGGHNALILVRYGTYQRSGSVGSVCFRAFRIHAMDALRNSKKINLLAVAILFLNLFRQDIKKIFLLIAFQQSLNSG
jgi:hypothetical protein